MGPVSERQSTGDDGLTAMERGEIVCRAVKNRWPIDPADLGETLDVIRDTLRHSKRENNKLRAVEAMLTANAQNIGIDTKEDDRAAGTTGTGGVTINITEAKKPDGLD